MMQGHEMLSIEAKSWYAGGVFIDRFRMSKICVVCGDRPMQELRPAGEPEDCGVCGAKAAVQEEEEGDEAEDEE